MAKIFGIIKGYSCIIMKQSIMIPIVQPFVNSVPISQQCMFTCCNMHRHKHELFDGFKWDVSKHPSYIPGSCTLRGIFG